MTRAPSPSLSLIISPSSKSSSVAVVERASCCSFGTLGLTKESGLLFSLFMSILTASLSATVADVERS